MLTAAWDLLQSVDGGVGPSSVLTAAWDFSGSSDEVFLCSQFLGLATALVPLFNWRLDLLEKPRIFCYSEV